MLSRRFCQNKSHAHESSPTISRRLSRRPRQEGRASSPSRAAARCRRTADGLRPTRTTSRTRSCSGSRNGCLRNRRRGVAPVADRAAAYIVGSFLSLPGHACCTRRTSGCPSRLFYAVWMCFSYFIPCSIYFDLLTACLHSYHVHRSGSFRAH